VVKSFDHAMQATSAVAEPAGTYMKQKRVGSSGSQGQDQNPRKYFLIGI